MISPEYYCHFFETATGGKTPYDYQIRLACGDSGSADSVDSADFANGEDHQQLSRGAICESKLINIPTGLGKTAAVVLAWLANRTANSDPKQRNQWARRLVYCLPMRTLVEQTRDEISKWLDALLANSESLGFTAEQKGDLNWLADHSPIILMGGEENDDAKKEWDIHPERPAILIGTQDMLLSRALNRGYGMSRYRWPMHFGLLNNDALWVMDETQLMGVGVETSAQLDGFRRHGKPMTFHGCPTWWMSATLDSTRLATVDHPKPGSGWLMEKLSESEQTSGHPYKLMTAQKQLSSAPFSLTPTTKNDYAKQLAAFIKENHQSGSLTLVVVNRVSRAREVFEALTKITEEKVALIHSRFRPKDRKKHAKLLSGNGDRIVIATQAVEAGVDVSARLLITELAPWSSLVQRMGRCNRYAKISDAKVIWIDIQPKDEKDELALPYSKEQFDKSRLAIEPLSDASLQALCKITVEEEPLIRPVIRRRDLTDLFDTTPDLCGQDIDISRYIRDGEDSDVQFFWREIEEKAIEVKESQPQRDELCRVAIGEAGKFLKNDKMRTWLWNALEKKWEKAKRSRPGAVYLIAADSGGYDDALGWTGNLKNKPTPYPPDEGKSDTPPAYGDNNSSFLKFWQTIAEHTQFVVSETDEISTKLLNETPFAEALQSAALWHDIGKAHEEFQKMLRDGDDLLKGTLWAKSDHKGGNCERYGFRHELASALAWLLKAPADVANRDLVAYLIASHHGKVRLSIRSLPNETGPKNLNKINQKNPEVLFARGIWSGDELPAVPLDGFTSPEVKLDLSFMQMGEGEHGASWLARTIALRDRIDLGAFRLAYLETLLRAADARASSKKTP